MNERLRIRLRLNRRRLRVESLSAEGVVLRGETDAWPRGMLLEFDARSAASEMRLRWVQQRYGWHPWRFRLEAFSRDGDLVFTGVEPGALPPGYYWYRLKIADLVISRRKRSVRLRENQESLEIVDVEEDPRKVILKNDFDADIGRLLDGSRLDGGIARAWLKDRRPRDRRKACLLNLLAKLRSFPARAPTLLESAETVFFADVDRAYLTLRPGAQLLSTLRALAVAGGKQRFYDEGRPLAATHEKLRQKIPDAARESFVPHSFRQTGSPSLQLVVWARPRTEGSYAEADLDLGNPLQDVVGFFVHLGELIDPGKTDHLALWKDLKRDRAVARFLNYQVATMR